MATRTVKDQINDGGTDLRQGLGRLNFGTMLENFASPTVDAADRTVDSHIHEMTDSAGEAEYGIILHVHANAGGSAGPKAVITTGAPGAGQVLVEYTAGRPKLTFAAADAITTCRCHWLKMPLTRDGESTVATLAREVS